jgi:hypothetical protein
MRTVLGHLALCAAVSVVLVTTVGSEARGGLIDMTVTIDDVTTGSVLNVTIDKGNMFDGSNPADPNTITTNAAFDAFTANNTGLEFTNLSATSNNPGSSTNGMITLGGTAQIVPGGLAIEDTFKVTIDASQTSFTLPSGTSASLSNSTGATIFNTTGASADQQSIQSFYDPTNALYGKSGPATPVASFALPASTAAGTSLSGPPVSTVLLVLLAAVLDDNRTRYPFDRQRQQPEREGLVRVQYDTDFDVCNGRPRTIHPHPSQPRLPQPARLWLETPQAVSLTLLVNLSPHQGHLPSGGLLYWRVTVASVARCKVVAHDL